MKAFRPFITEMSIALLCIIGIVFGLLVGDFFHISIKPHLISFSVCLILVIILLFLFVNCLLRGVLALVDLLFSLYETVNGKVINCVSVNASVFADRVTEEHGFANPVKFCYIIKGKKRGRSFQTSVISSEYIDYTLTETYVIKYGRYSKILVDLKVDK